MLILFRSEKIAILLINDWSSHIDHTAVYIAEQIQCGEAKAGCWLALGNLKCLWSLWTVQEEKNYNNERAVLNTLLFCSWYLPLSGISTRVILSEARDGQV